MRKYLEAFFKKKANKFLQEGMLILFETNCFYFAPREASLVLDFDSRV